MVRRETDLTGRWSGTALATERPTSTAAVADVLRRGRPVSVVGGRTSLVAGWLPDDTVLLETSGLVGLAVDADEGAVTVGAGVTLLAVQHAAAEAGLAYGVDLAARDAATIGGTVATNAVGLHGIAFGPTRAQVLGLEAVLADGSVVSSLARPAQTSLGPDWAQLLVGSEGVLAVVTGARLRLRPRDGTRALAALPAADATAAVAVVRAARRLPGLRALEWVDAEMARLAGGPFPGYCLVEVGGASADACLAVLADLDPPVVAVDAERARLWGPREACTEVLLQVAAERGTTCHKLDVAVPLPRVAEVVAGLPAGSAVFGHLALGTLHVNVFAPAAADVDDRVLRQVAACGGAVAAEHGVGRAKAGWLSLSRSPAELALLRTLKAAMDPRGLLNPGVLLT